MSSENELEASIAALQAQRHVLGDRVVEAAISALREKAGTQTTPGERKLVTIVFADISGFTRMSETRDPEEVRDLITAAFDVLVPVIERYDGTIDKFMGDAVMALFGAKVAREDDARRALMAALDMRSAFEAFIHGTSLDLGIHFGVNSGTVVTGHVGASGSGTFSVMGDAVNLAARLEDLSEIGEILVGPTTRELSGEGFAFEARDPVPLKGMRDPVPVFALLSRQEAPASRGIQAPLVGRETEVSVIQAALIRAKSGVAAAVAVSGEAGTGKSRLVAEARLRSPSDIRWLQVRSVSHNQGIGFGTLRTLVHAVLELASDAPHERVASEVRSRVVTRFQREECEDAFAQIALLAGVKDSSHERIAGIADELLERRLATTVCAWLQPRDAEPDLAIVWEDLHWADRSSLRVLGHMAHGALPNRCTQVLSFRPIEELRSAVLSSGTELIELDPLSHSDSAKLVDALVRSARLGNDVVETILARAEGNPFFLEEIIQSLLDSGAITVTDKQVVATPNLNVGAIPTSLQGVLMARIDQLAPSEKRILQTASVIGRIFDLSLLDGVLVDEERLKSSLFAVLESLQALDLVRGHEIQAVAACGRYKFKHALTHEVAYNSVLLATRRKLHRAAGNMLAASAEGQADTAPMIAYHFENSDEPSLAAPFLRLAAEASARAHAPREAVAYYRRIVALEPFLSNASEGVRALAAAHEALGDLLRVGGRPAQALESLARAFNLVPETAALHRATILRRSGLAWMTRRDAERAIEFYEEAAGLLQDVSERATDWWREWIELQLDLAWAKSWLGANKEAHQVLHSSFEDIEAHGNLGQRARCRDRLVIARLFREAAHPSDEAIVSAREALEMAQEWGELRGIGMAHFTLGYGLLFRREFDEAKVQLSESLRIALHIGDVEYEVAARSLLGITARLKGDLVEVEGGTEATIESARGASMEIYIAVGLANTAWAALRRGRTVEAHSAASEAAEIWQRQAWRLVWLAHWPLLSIAIDRRSLVAAKAHCEAMLSPLQYDLGAEIMKLLRDGYDLALAGEDELAFITLARARGYATEQNLV